MSLQDKFKKWSTKQFNLEVNQEKILTHKLNAELAELYGFQSTKQLYKSARYQALSQEIINLTYGFEYACYDDANREAKPFCRAVLWNLDHGAQFKGILETLRNRALVSHADIYFFPSCDIGMARSHNQNIVRNLALELGYNYFFSTSYLNVPNPNASSDATNLIGIEGNAIMTKLPMANLRIVPIKNQFDPMKGTQKKIGCQKVLLADVLWGTQKITLVCLNFPQYSSQRQRAEQLKVVLKRLKQEERGLPMLIAGDLKTHTYNCKNSFYFQMSILNKIFRGFDYIQEEHHACPEKYFERRIFDIFKQYGFLTTEVNEMAQANYHVNIGQLYDRVRKANVLDKLIESLLRPFQSNLALKTDWFAANDLLIPSHLHQSERPKVINHLYHQGQVVSAHDPILLDFEAKIPEPMPSESEGH